MEVGHHCIEPARLHFAQGLQTVPNTRVVSCCRSPSSSSTTSTHFPSAIIVFSLPMEWRQTTPRRKRLSPLVADMLEPDFRHRCNDSIDSPSQPFRKPIDTSQPQARLRAFLHSVDNSSPVLLSPVSSSLRATDAYPTCPLRQVQDHSHRWP